MDHCDRCGASMEPAGPYGDGFCLVCHEELEAHALRRRAAGRERRPAPVPTQDRGQRDDR